MSLRPLKRILNKVHIRQGIAFTLMFAAGTGIAFLWVFTSLHRSLVDDSRESVTSTLLAYWALYRDEGRTSLIRSIRTDSESESLILLTDKNGQVIASHAPGNLFRDLLPQLKDYPFPEPGTFRIRNPEGKRMMFYTGALHISDNLILRVVTNMDRSFATFRKIRQRFFEVVLVLLLISFIAGSLSTVGALRPINTLNRELLALSDTADVSRRLPLRDTGDQLDHLTERINRFLERIESLVTGMRHALDYTAHDLRTPLARMKARAESALIKKNPSSDDLREALVGCLEESEIITRMVSTLMDITEAEQGVLRLNTIPTDIASALAEIHDLYLFVAEEKGIDLTFHVADNLPKLEADPVRLRQIVGNLLDNALKFSPPGSRTELLAQNRGSTVLISVTDSGPGINPADMPHLYERLYRGETSRTTRGLGLGLSLVKALTEAHGGTVTAENIPGGGACFTLTFNTTFRQT